MRKRLPTYLFFLLLLLVSNLVLSQQREYIIGKLIDAKTQEPIVFASIRIKDRALGIISNTDGSFKIPLKYKEYGDIIEISSMGYQTKEILIQDFSIYKLNNVRLQPATLELEEAIVMAKKKRKKKLSATQIVRKAIKAIPKNYPSTKFSSIGYYRDYQLRKEKYVNLNEAILEVIDSGFDKNDHNTTKVRIYNYQSNEDFKKDIIGKRNYDYKNYKKYIDKAYLFNYGGNEFSILRIHDAIRNHKINSYDFVNVMQRDFVSNHNFKKEDEISFDDEMLYKISFTKFLMRYRIYGTIYISKKDYAINKMEYSVYDKTKTNDNTEKNKHGVNYEIIFEVITEYRKKYSKMYLNYISFFNNFQVSEPPKFMIRKIAAVLACKCFELTFNNEVDEFYATKKKHYNFQFDGKKIQIDKIKIESHKKHIVFVYPDVGSSEFWRITNELEEKLSIEVTGLRDATSGANLINEARYNTYKQFREFFVQEIKPNGSALNDTMFMKKNVPIFEDQPIIKPDNFDEYWMNTPFQNIKN